MEPVNSDGKFFVEKVGASHLYKLILRQDINQKLLVPKISLLADESSCILFVHFLD